MSKRPIYLIAYFLVLILCGVPRFSLADLTKGVDKGQTKTPQKTPPPSNVKTPSSNSVDRIRIEELQKKIAIWQQLDVTTVKPFESVKQAREVLEKYKKQMKTMRNDIAAADPKLASEMANDIKEFKKEYGDIESAIEEYKNKRKVTKKLENTERLKKYYEERADLDSKVRSMGRKREKQLASLESDINRMNKRLEWVDKLDKHSDAPPIFKRELASLANETRITGAKRELEDLQRLKQNSVKNYKLGTNEIRKFEEAMKEGENRREKRRKDSTEKPVDYSVFDQLEDDYWYRENVDKNADAWKHKKLEDYEKELEFMDITYPELTGPELERKRSQKLVDKKGQLNGERKEMVKEARDYLNKRIRIGNDYLETTAEWDDSNQNFEQYRQSLSELENEAAQATSEPNTAGGYDTLLGVPVLDPLAGWEDSNQNILQVSPGDSIKILNKDGTTAVELRLGDSE